MTKNSVKSESLQSAVSSLIANVKYISKAKIALAIFVLGSPFLYWGLILVVLFNPDIMTWLGLEPFVQYLIKLQSAGYDNLVLLKDHEFADYFFHFHAASLLVLGTINSLFVIFIILFLDDYPKFDKDYYLSTHGYNLSKFSLKYRPILMLLPLILLVWFIIFAPSQMSYGRKFSPNFFGIGLFMFFGAAFSFFFQGYLIMVMSNISHVFWPKLKNLLGGK